MSSTSYLQAQDCAPHLDTPSRDATPPISLRASISPPPSRRREVCKSLQSTNGNGGRAQIVHEQHEETTTSSLAAIEAGEIRIRDHLEYFSTHLAQYAKPFASLPIPAFEDLYLRNQHPHGKHFVIHQHDHPVAGVHYDLRLQINETSSISWAIMYGLPGNPNSRRLNRNATETRVHNLWVG
jgi:hypothetical protein